jgi:hypothetical protein
MYQVNRMISSITVVRGRIHPGLLASVLVAGCAIDFGSSPVVPPDSWDDPADTAGEMEAESDADDIEEEDLDATDEGCDPGGSNDYCDGGILMRCNATGTGFVEVPCSPGICIEEIFAHCIGMGIHNVDDTDLLCAGTSGLGPAEIPADTVWVVFDTDTGAILAGNDDLTEIDAIRSAGLGDIGGYVFSHQDQPGSAPALGILSLTHLTVPPEVGFVAMGPRAGVVLVCGPVVVEGLTGSFALPFSSVSETPVPGAAGGMGGRPDSTAYGGGPGGGGEGGHVSSILTLRAGGGGGSHGEAGGRGGSYGAATGGAGGAAYGVTNLVPLTAGSGGGSGGVATEPACSSMGGSGGGAFLLASNLSIEVLPGGAIDVSGGGGSGGMACTSDGAGGAGGGAGGGMLLESPVVIVQGHLTAVGGGGGAGSRDVDAAGISGRDGLLVLGTAAGGQAAGFGTKGGDGGSPGFGNGENGADSSGVSEPYMGGGGGGDGIIRINGIDVDLEEASLHPVRGSALFSLGDLILF